MKRKLLSILVSICMTLSLISLPTYAETTTDEVKLGDYVQIGTYQGEPILWRCVAFEKIKGTDLSGNPIMDSTDTSTTYKEGYAPLMLSDKILSLKAYDANGTNGTHTRGYTSGNYRKSYGSNHWGSSNIRDWLNSDKTAGNIQWTCGNAPTSSAVYEGYNSYDDESGFLNGFTEGEKKSIKTVTQKSVLDGYEYSTSKTEGVLDVDTSIAGVVQNYSTAYAEDVTDKVFLCDVQQINNVYQNSDVLGDEYYIGLPSQKCIDESDFEHKSLSTDKTWYSWLRTPYTADFGSQLVRCVYPNGTISNYQAYYSPYGVRPAFYLADGYSIKFDGAGTVDEPYELVAMHTVTYDANGGETLSKTTDELFDLDKADLSVTASRVGSKFVGWNTDKYAKVGLDDYTVSGDVTLYAIWIDMKKVTYDANGGIQVSKTNDYIDENSFADLSVQASRYGYKFVGWNTNKNATTGLSQIQVTDDIKLFAIWRTIQLGEYVEMGTYYGQPILWRCVSFDKIKGRDFAGNPIIDPTDTKQSYEEGYLPLMMADRIITLKAFDASGTNAEGSHGRGKLQGKYRKEGGSNYWADSNIRDWLNSSASSGEVVWTCGNAPDSAHTGGYNAYDKEAGFLSNFNENEKASMMKVKQRILLDGLEYSTTNNANSHIYGNNMMAFVQNYATAYSEEVVDTVFLPDVKQIDNVYKNTAVLGNNYYNGIPTTEAIENSNYQSLELTDEDVWWSWLSTPNADDSPGRNTRIVHQQSGIGQILYTNCFDGMGGVRPTFYYDPLAIKNLEGVGSKTSPYSINDAEFYVSDVVSSKSALGVIATANNFKKNNVTSFGFEFIPQALYNNEKAKPRRTEYTGIELEDGATFASVLSGIPSDWKDIVFVCTPYAKIGNVTVYATPKCASINGLMQNDFENAFILHDLEDETGADQVIVFKW